MNKNYVSLKFHARPSFNNSKMGKSKVNPAPIGLFGFAITTALLNLKNAHFISADDIIFGTGLIVGGMAQMIAGVLEFFAGSQFGCVAFTLYGAFWISLVYVNEFMDGSSDGPFACYLFIWGLFSLFMTMATFAPGMHFVSKTVFISLTTLFFLLSIIHGMLANDADASVHGLETLAGLIGIFCASFAFYDGMAGVLNSPAVYGREFLPLGPRSGAQKVTDAHDDVVTLSEAA
ncbi:GPR1/FUN34/yaaH family protein [Kipferlia bialata]|uniref:GPR1/FUN34/yaaH family protein n=1 Tax=Kipferlia bialata TaxID=797122 RepID=A0A9K3GFI8_9EUKA|nr:GPR1/FUN34/yaaH family protein [Kipferlia bialata]|eukprot:g1786.t1